MLATRRALLGASLATLAACATPPAAPAAPVVAPAPPPPDPHVVFNQLLDDLSTRFLKTAPEYATALAVSEERAGGRYIDRLSDNSAAGIAADLQLQEQALAELRAFPQTGLTAGDIVSLEVVATSLENDLATQRYGHGDGGDSPYVLTQIVGAYTNYPDFLASQHPVTSRDQADAYLTRLAGYAKMLDNETERLNADAGAGIIPADFAITGAVGQLRHFTRTAPAQNVLVAAYAQKLGEVEGLAEADKAAMTARAEAILRDDVLPAYGRQIDALNTLKPRATHDAGVWRLPGGDEYYANQLRRQTTTNMSADEIHNMGVALCADLNSQMDAILRAQGMTRGTLAQRLARLNRRPDQLYPNNDAGREQMLTDLNAELARVRAIMPRAFGHLAQASLEIKRVPAFTEAGAPAGYYMSAALDGSRPGAYYINMRDTRELPRYTLPTLNHHEGIPGHHWQISIAQESGSLPFIRSALLGFNAYAEGWALYAEQLADELGVYEDDPLARLGYLQSAAFRASRLVVDTGMHAKRWTREQAIASMTAATGNPVTSTTTEIERYTSWPGQACGYMVGRQAINGLRTKAQTELGATFTPPGFHDAVLTNGSVPLSVLGTIVDGWIAATKAM